MISVPFENNTNFNHGPESAVTNALDIKPVQPMQLNENWNLINGVTLPVVYQGERFPNEGTPFGLGDLTYQGLVSPAKAGKFIWGVGPAVVMPTGADERMNSRKWSAGAAVVGLVMPGQWVVGGVLSNVWSFAGDSDYTNVSLFSFQYFINNNMAGGWYLTSAPTITANREANSDNKWTVPFSGAFGRVFKIGNQPVNLKIAAHYNVERPEYA